MLSAARGVTLSLSDHRAWPTLPALDREGRAGGEVQDQTSGHTRVLENRKDESEQKIKRARRRRMEEEEDGS